MQSVVILVDGSKEWREYNVARFMGVNGLEVYGAEHAKEALELILKHPPHVVITSSHPGIELDGSQFAAEIVKALGYKPRIILWTSGPINLDVVSENYSAMLRKETGIETLMETVCGSLPE